MEEIIEGRLKEKYKHLVINVNLVEWRKYKINIKLKIDSFEYGKEIIYIWNAHYTEYVNIDMIINIIDNFILNVYRKENKYE